MDWSAIFVPTLPLMEVMARGTLVYLALFLLLRILPRREMGSIGATDLLVVVLIADAVQNAMGAEYRSVTEGLLLVVTILFWSYIVDWLDHRFPQLNLVSSPPQLLVRNGRILRANLERELMTEDELMSQLRERGVKSAAEVERAYIEGNGKISVIRRRRSAR